jgi:hypothetical protein
MRAYRIYQVDAAGHVVAPPKIVEADTDEEAVTQAAQWARDNAFAVEIWDEGRRVGLVDCRPGEV